MVGLLLVLTILFMGWSEQVQSQEKYPTRPIELIVGAGPGGGTDSSARIIAAYLNKKWGVPVNVVNKPGGNFIPATFEVYQAAPNGYTLLVDSAQSSSMLGVVVKDLPFKVMDRTFIAITNTAAMVLVVPSTSPFKTLKDVEIEAKRNPEGMTWSSVGGSSNLDFTIRQFFKAIGVDVLKTKPIITQGGAQAVVLTAGGHIVLGCSTTSSTMPAIKGGTVKGLAITSKNRFPDLPDVLTTAELGYPTVESQFWAGISGPPNLPSHITQKWNDALEEMLKDPEVISRLRNVGAMPAYRDARATREFVIKETEEVYKLWGLIKGGG